MLEPEWRSVPLAPALSPHQVHLWRAWLTMARADLRRLEQGLSPDEAARAARMKEPRARDRFVASRGILRSVLGRYLGLEGECVRLRASAEGKPLLAGEHEASGIGFNLAHSQDLALIAIGLECRVGVDVEYVRPMPDALELARRWLPAKVAAELQALPPGQRDEAFFWAWTRFEAGLKATGEGLPPHGSRAWQPSGTGDQPGEGTEPHLDPSWWMATLSPAPGAIASVAVEGRGWELVFLEYQG